LVRRNTVFLVGLMRMRADGAIDLRKALGDREQRVETPHPRRNGNDTSDASGFSAGDDTFQIVGKIGKVEMAMAVDKHFLQTGQAALGSI
jgi:hypothetical protein